MKRLQNAYSEGHISHEEMDERLDRAFAARTQGDLAQALDSLPQEKVSTSSIGAITGRIKRRGAWRVPRHLKVESAFGRVTLDMSRAVFEHPEVDIELRLTTGRARIVVPRNSTVEIDGLETAWKATAYKPRRSTRPDGPTIRISGSMGFGRLKVRHAWR